MSKKTKSKNKSDRRSVESKRIGRVKIDSIHVPERRRSLNLDAIERIAGSIKAIGQKQPILVRRNAHGKFCLVAGWHRLEAAKSLGRTKIDAVITRGGQISARLVELAENMHRVELSKMEKLEHIEHWRKQLIKKQKKTERGGRQPNDEKITAAAEELGVSRDEVARAERFAKMAQSVRKEAKTRGLADNQAALLMIADEPDEVAQRAKLMELVGKKNNKPPSSGGGSLTSRVRVDDLSVSWKRSATAKLYAQAGSRTQSRFRKFLKTH